MAALTPLEVILGVYGITNPDALKLEDLQRLQNVLTAYIKERAKRPNPQQPLFP